MGRTILCRAVSREKSAQIPEREGHADADFMKCPPTDDGEFFMTAHTSAQLRHLIPRVCSSSPALLDRYESTLRINPP